MVENAVHGAKTRKDTGIDTIKILNRKPGGKESTAKNITKSAYGSNLHDKVKTFS